MSGRTLVALAALLAPATVAACAASPHAHRPSPPRPKTSAPADASDAGKSAEPSGIEVPSLDVLASRGPTDMPLMREVLRSPDATKPTLLATGAADGCFRAVVSASVPVQARFVDGTGATCGAELSGVSGLVPPRGPACARRGETLRLVVEPANAAITARAVVWRAP